MRQVIAGALVMWVGFTGISDAETGKPPATYILKSEIEKILSQVGPSTDQQVRIVPAFKSNIGVGIVRWPAEPRGVLSHSQVDEVYYMLEGTGTIVSGGTMPGAKSSGSSEAVNVTTGPSDNSASIAGGASRHVGPGDVVIIPAGVPHQWLSIETPVKYVIVRIDSDKVLPVGYENPRLKK